MLAIDTNILIRFILRDDPNQAQLADRVFLKAIEDGDEIFVSDITLCELAWVLKRTFKFDWGQILKVLRNIYETDIIRFSSEDRVVNSLDSYETGRADFADYLILQHCKAVGAQNLISFDKAALGEPGFVSP